MKPPFHRSRARCARWASAAGFALGVVLFCPAAWAQYTVSQLPMLAATPPPPNIVLTIDDSGSMTWTYVPDSLVNYGTTAGFASSAYNALYYNPATSYPIPPDSLGQPVPQSQNYALTSFTAAWYDGFNPAGGSVNLATNYAVTISQRVAAAPQAANPGTVSAAYYYLYNGVAGSTTCPPLAAGAVLNTAVSPPPDSCFSQVMVGATSGPAICTMNTISGPTTVLCSALGSTATQVQAASWDERQNFANWYSFYRTRHLAIVSSAARALQDPSLLNARVAWQALNTCTDFTGTGCSSYDNRIRRFTGQHKTDFYNWLFQIPAANTTPTRLAWYRAGEYFRTSGPNSPYGIDPNQSPTVTGNELLCVNNFNITLTDGLWNTMNENGVTSFCAGNTCGDYDSTPHTFPDGTQYAPSTAAASTTIYGERAGGGDSGISTGGLADIAFYYWANNLRPDLTSFHVQPYAQDSSTSNPATGNANDPTWPYWNPVNDPATWPHMVNFTVGVGLTGFLSLPGLVWSGDAHDPTPGNAYMNLLQGAPNCTTPTVNCTWPPDDLSASGGGFTGAAAGNGNVYDLWHAAINSRGNAFSAQSPQQLVSAMASIISRIEAASKGSSAAAGNSTSLTAGTQLFAGSYLASDWHGTVSANNLSPTTGAVVNTAWQTSASSIPAYTARSVFSAASALPGGSGTISTSPGIVFSASSLPTAWSNYFVVSGGTPTQAVNYLLGDPSNEVRNGGGFRNRLVTVLGDIVDSSPVYTFTESHPLFNLLQPENASSNNYAAFVATKSSRTPMVYVGANDGMLHGFDASYSSTSATGATATSGNEVLAYVPHAVVPSLSALANPNYLHVFSVDGQIAVDDAYFAPGQPNSACSGTTPAAACGWHTVLVGTTGAGGQGPCGGGQGVFALDVSNPSSFSASNVLWDLDGSLSPFGNGDPNLGFTIGQPAIARLNNGDWVAVFGNGYLSARGSAVLYLVRLSDGLVRTIDAIPSTPAAVSPCAPANNGLGSPTLVDVDQNGTTDFVYAGDLQGNLWKFDLSSSTPANWGVAYASGSAPAPLFVATTAAGVVQPIVAAPNVVFSESVPGALMVYFATGRIFATGDPSSTQTQSVYAIQDQGALITGTRSSLVTQGLLAQQTVVTAPDGSGNAMIQTPYANPNPAGDGWFIDLPGSGERVLNEPIVARGMVIFGSVIPQAQPCSGGCSGFLYAVNAATGAGGTNFLQDATSGNFYDALLTEVGCIKGITLVSNGTTMNIYAFGNGSSGSGSGASGSGSGSGGSSSSSSSSGGSSSGGGTPPGPPDCAQLGTCQQFQGKSSNPGRMSWHEVVQPQ